MRLLQWLLWACVAAATAHEHALSKREASSQRVVCYYTNWSVYRPGTAKFSPQNINPYLCTHLIYAFGGLSRENGLRPYDKYQDIEQGGYAKFTGLKTYNKQLKTMLAIGGWNEGSARFSSLVADEERRAEFVKNAVRFLRQNHFDGLDLDWEYPAFRDGGKPRDRANYAALLVQELREEFDREHSKTGRPRLLLTMAVPAGIEYIDKGYDIPKLNRYLDFMNILSYDYHSAFEPSVNHHAPLYPMEEENEYNFDTQLCIDYTVKHLVELGADRDKLVVGIPTYGRSYTLFNPDATEIGAPADGPGEQGDATREKGYLAYYEICENLEKHDWQVEKPNPSAMGPYAFKDNQWVGYDDEDIIRMKARYVSENGLGGIMFWAIDNDDFRGKCHGRPYPLIEAGKEAMLSAGGLTNEVSEGARPASKGSPRTRTPSGGGQSGRSRGRKRKNKNRSSTTSTTTSTTRRTPAATSTTPKYVTPEPPTTPDPGSDFKCKDEGFFPHPRDCKKYFWCLDSGPSNLGIVAHQFTCPSGLVFNKAADSCDYARNVICKSKPKAEGSTTARPPPTTTSSTSRATRRTTTTTTTTTTPPEEEYDDEEYEDEDEEEGPRGDEEDPKVIQELLNLIKKLGGVEQLERQLQKQDKEGAGEAAGISRSLYDKVLARTAAAGGGSGRGAALYGSSTPAPREASTKYTSLFRNRQRGPQNEGLEETRTKFERPKYVTIQRNRPSTTAPETEDDEDLDDDEYDIDDEDEGEEKPVAEKPETSRAAAREYVNIRRERPQRVEETDVTTPKYTTIQRHKSRPDEENEPEEQETPKTSSVRSSGESKSDDEEEFPAASSDTDVEKSPKEIPSPKRPSRLNIINKKGRKETEIVPEVEKETEAPVVKVSAERKYIDAASIRSDPFSRFDQNEHSETTTSLPLTRDFLLTSTHRQVSDATIDQVSDVPLLNNYLNTVRFRSTTDKPSIYLDDQSYPSISPLPDEYISDISDAHEVNIVVARSPVPPKSSVSSGFPLYSTPMPSITSPESKTENRPQVLSSSVETNTESLDFTLVLAKEQTEETTTRRRGTTLPTIIFASSTTQFPKLFSRHSFSSRRRSTTTVATIAATDPVSLSTSNYFRDIASSSPKKGLRPSHNFFPKLRKNATVVVTTNDVLTPKLVNTQSSVLAQELLQENVSKLEEEKALVEPTGNQYYPDTYLTTTEVQLNNTSSLVKEFDEKIPKHTAVDIDSVNGYSSYPEQPVPTYNSVVPIYPTEFLENTKVPNKNITDEPEILYDFNYTSVTDYSGLSFHENTRDTNSTIYKLSSSDNKVDFLLQGDSGSKDSKSQFKKGKSSYETTLHEPLTSSDEKISNIQVNNLPTTIQHTLTDDQQNKLKIPLTVAAITSTVTPTELYFDPETTMATVIETLPPPTTTHLTPTVTRVVTSVTESGTTERQRIAVNRVPYRSLIAAIRGKQQMPSSNADLYDTTFPTSFSDNATDLNLLPATTAEPSTSKQRFRYITTADIFSGSPEPKIEKIMEVNRITTVTVKADSQSFLTRYFTREQTTMHTDLQDTEKGVQANTDEKHTPVINTDNSDNTTDSLFGLDRTETTETAILPTTELHMKENKDLVTELSFPVFETDGEMLANDSYSYSNAINDTNLNVSTEDTTSTSSTTPISTLVERARTRSPGFRRRTTERATVSKDTETPSPVKVYRKPSRTRNRQYRPSTTVAPTETADPLLVKLRRTNRPINTSRSDIDAARKRGGFSRRRIYRLSSTTETPITVESNNTEDTSGNKDSIQKDYTRGRAYRLPYKSTTENIFTPELQTVGLNYLGNDSISSTDVLNGDSFISLEVTTMSVTEYNLLTNPTFANNTRHTFTQGRPEESSTHTSQEEVTNKFMHENSYQEKYNTSEPTFDSFQTTVPSKKIKSNKNIYYSDDIEPSTINPTLDIPIEPNNFAVQESSESMSTENKSRESITENFRVYATEIPHTAFAEEILSSSVPTIITQSNINETKTHNYNNVTVTDKDVLTNTNETRPYRKKMVVKKRRRRPTEESLTNGENKENEVNKLIKNSKEDKDVIQEKGESLAVLEDTNRNYISTESSFSAEFYSTADNNGDQFVKLSILNKLNPNLPPGQVPVTGSDYIESTDYSDYDKYSSKEYYDPKISTNTVTRFPSRFTYSSSETSNEVQDDARAPSELSGGGFPSRKTQFGPDDIEATDGSSRERGRGSSRFRAQAKNSEKNQDAIRRRKVVRKQRPEAVTDVEVTDEEASPVNITTRPLGRQRTPGTLFSPRQRQRATTPLPAAAEAATTAAPRQPSGAQRRVVKRRKFGPRGQSTTGAPQPAATSPGAEDPQTQGTTSRGEAVTTAAPARKFAFPRRRPAAGDDPPTTPTAVGDAVVQPSALVEDTQAPGEALPDLAHPAVAAIARLATQQPPPGAAPEAAAPQPTGAPPARRFTTASAPASAAPLRRQPLRPRPFSRVAAPTPPEARTAAPPPDYDYYDEGVDDAGVAVGGSKVKVHDDGYIECLDQGNFPHPYSCKKFISCAKMESGGLLGWEYTCPRQLSFDPVGGICNWSAGLGCKE